MIQTPSTGEFFAYGVIFGKDGEQRATFIDRERAMQAATRMAGVVCELYVGPFVAPETKAPCGSGPQGARVAQAPGPLLPPGDASPSRPD